MSESLHQRLARDSHNRRCQLGSSCTESVTTWALFYEDASEVIRVVQEWLRDEATADLMAAETTEFHWLQIDAEQCSCGEWREDETGLIHDRHVARAGLAFLANSLEVGIGG